MDSFATERYLLDEMSDVDRDAFEEHYFSCEVCAEDVRTASAMAQGARGVFGTGAAAGTSTATVSRLQPKKTTWYRSAALPWALAASLAALATYQAVSLGDGARALHPVTLRPDSRGQEPVVRSDSASNGITLAIEVNGAREGAELAFDIKDAAGRAIVSGREPAPAPGTPLLLLLPQSVISEPGRYVMSVDDRASGQSLGTYRFVLSR